jgi:hypothetical protein
MNNLTALFNALSTQAEELQAAGNEEAFSRYTVQALFERHEAVSAKLTARNEALQASALSVLIVFDL